MENSQTEPKTFTLPYSRAVQVRDERGLNSLRCSWAPLLQLLRSLHNRAFAILVMDLLCSQNSRFYSSNTTHYTKESYSIYKLETVNDALPFLHMRNFPNAIYSYNLLLDTFFPTGKPHGHRTSNSGSK